MFVVRSRHQPRQLAAHVDASKIHDVKKLCSSSKHLCLKLNNQRTTANTTWSWSARLTHSVCCGTSNMKWGRLSIVIMHGEERRLVDDEEYNTQVFLTPKQRKNTNRNEGHSNYSTSSSSSSFRSPHSIGKLPLYIYWYSPSGSNRLYIYTPRRYLDFFCAAKPFATRVPWKSQMMTSWFFASFLLLNLKLAVSFVVDWEKLIFADLKVFPLLDTQ